MTTKTQYPALPLEATTSIALAITEAQSIDEVTAMGLELQSLIKQARERYAELKLTGPVVEVEAPKVEAQSSGTIADGTYTVAFEDGKHVTLRFKTQPDDHTFMPGKQLVSYLNGPDNWSNYKAFATMQRGQLVGFRKYDGQLNRQRGAVTRLQRGNDAQLAGLKSYGMAAGKCGVCGRKLTTPESIERGIGPECASKFGM